MATVLTFSTEKLVKAVSLDHSVQLRENPLQVDSAITSYLSRSLSPLQGTSDPFQSPPWANSSTQHATLGDGLTREYVSVNVCVCGSVGVGRACRSLESEYTLVQL